MSEALKIELRFHSLLKERGLTQKQLSEMTGIRQAAISNLSRGNIERLNLNHVKKIATTLGIYDISKIIVIIRNEGRGD